MTRRRLSPQQRRAQIVRAAREHIAGQEQSAHPGVAKFSLRDIDAAAGVSMGTVTYHFASVNEILSAVVIAEAEEFYSEPVEAARAESDPWQALTELIDPMFADTPRVEAHWRIWAHYWAAVARHPQMAEAYFDRIRHLEACCAEVVARGVEQGAFREVDPVETALKLGSYANGLGTQRAQGISSLTAEKARQWLHEFARALLLAGEGSGGEAC